MSSVRCACGQDNKDTVTPTPNVSHVLSDVALDAIVQDGPDDRMYDDDSGDYIPYEVFRKRAKRMYACWSCGRLLLEGDDGNYRIFVEEKR